MNPDFIKTNIRNSCDYRHNNKNFKKQSEVQNSVSFRGGIKSAVLGTAENAVKYLKEGLFTGTDTTFKYKDHVFETLKKGFGGTFDDCLNAAKLHKRFDQCISLGKDTADTITIHKPAFTVRLLYDIRDFFTDGICNLGISARDFINKHISSDGKAKAFFSSDTNLGFIGKTLNHMAEKKNARNAYYKLLGVLESAYEDADIAKFKQKYKGDAVLAAKDKIAENIAKMANSSITSASKKFGQYNTKTERAWNRLGTGFVSAMFARTDFYNISMLQSDDKEKAQKAGRKRFKQDMSRQGITAALTYFLLGAMQGKANSSIPYAVLSLGGITLVSEILSRKINHISLKPLSPQEAKEIAEKQGKNKKLKQGRAKFKGKAEKETSTAKPLSENNPPVKLTEPKPIDNVFKVFTDKADDIEKTIPVKESEPKSKNKNSIVKKVLKGIGAIVGVSLAVGFLRSKNILGINTLINNVSKGYNNFVKHITTTEFSIPKNQAEELLDHVKARGFDEQHKILRRSVDTMSSKLVHTGRSQFVRGVVPKATITENSGFYNLGRVESNVKKGLATALLFPIDTIKGLIGSANKVVRTVLSGPVPENNSSNVNQAAVQFVKKYAAKYNNALTSTNSKNALKKFDEELTEALTRHFSQATSKHKNTSLAMLSRVLITFISGYFFVNDYRNQVLIESKGEDVKRANATAKERVGHKMSNFMFNSLFMHLFNTVFENIYLSSILGATGVAMATEITNETFVRKSICTPTEKMNKDELIEYENKRLNDPGIKGDYYRWFMKVTGKKPISEKAKK